MVDYITRMARTACIYDELQIYDDSFNDDLADISMSVEVLHMSYIPYKAKTAVFYAVLLWIIGFVWGSIVFIVPSLKNLSSAPYISKYPAISFPLLIAYIILLLVLAPRYLKTTERVRKWRG
jgi:hypothetical protein